MKIYKYWTRAEKEIKHDGQPWEIVAFGHSNESESAAEQDASKSLDRMEKRITTGELGSPYEYSDRPLREELKEELRDEQGELEAVITRNAYGSLVLNCAKVMFVDMDFLDPLDPREMNMGCLPLFGGRKKYEEELAERIAAREIEMMEQIKTVLTSKTELGLRLYRTKNGLRLLITSHLYDPTSDESTELLKQFHSDPLYVKLCSVQECFRARLTAKPWRIAMDKPLHRFPWSTTKTEDIHRKWERAYEAKAQGLAVCSFEGALGSGKILPEVQRIIEVHDRYCVHDGDLV